MIIKRLIIGYTEVRIEKNEHRLIFLVAGSNDEGMREVTLTEFKAFLESIKEVCTNSWNRETRDKYNGILEYVNGL